MMAKKQRIGVGQPSSVDEHFDSIIKDRSMIDPKFVKVSPNDLPEWFDERLFETGQAFYTKNLISFGMVHLTGFIAVLSVPDIAEVLRYTKQSSTTCLCFKRISQTVLHIHTLFDSDILDAESKWYKAINVIRWKHALTSGKRVKEGLTGIYQKDMAITQASFIALALTTPREVGLVYTSEELEGLNHFWMVVGFLLGIPDRLNVCRETAEETREMCQKFLDEIFVKHMDEFTPEFEEMTNNSLDGLWYIDMNLNKNAFLHHAYKLLGIQCKVPLGWYSYFNAKYREMLFYLCCVPYIGAVIKITFNRIILASYWMLQNYPIIPRLAFGEKESQFKLYPRIY